MNVFIMKHDHKHGTDIKVYSSEYKAWFSAVEYMRDTADEWGAEDEVMSMSDDELWRSHPQITGETEFFSIEECEVL